MLILPTTYFTFSRLHTFNLLQASLHQTQHYKINGQVRGTGLEECLTNLNSLTLSSHEGTRMCTWECLVSRHFDIQEDILNEIKDTKVRTLSSLHVKFKWKMKLLLVQDIKVRTLATVHVKFKLKIKLNSSLAGDRKNLIANQHQRSTPTFIPYHIPSR